MKLITRNTDYAIRALRYIGKAKDRVISVTELTRELKIPHPFLRRILQSMQNGGLLSSTKGKGGGFALKKSLGKITVTDIIKIFQGPVRLSDCGDTRNICIELETCLFRMKLSGLEKVVAEHLKKITIESIS